MYAEKYLEFQGDEYFDEETTIVTRQSDNKHFTAHKFKLDNEEAEKVLRERSLMKEFKHNNIVNYVESFQHKDELIVVSELCDYANLMDITIQNKKGDMFVSEETVLSLVY